jgi:tRNA wybutosine-synthesizing protein 3
MTVFDQRKRRILEDLKSDEPDLSPKGRPDDEILKLLQVINSNDNYVSTSSCSGRAVVFLDGDNNRQGEEAQGRWLMTRHTRFGEALFTCTLEELFTLLFGSLKKGVDWRSNERPSRLVTLKFEPLVYLYGVRVLTEPRLCMYYVVMYTLRHGCFILL